jgi:hypothetical protein
MVTTGSQKITVWGPGGTPLGMLRVITNGLWYHVPREMCVRALTPSPTHAAATRANSLGQLYTHTAVRRAEPSMSCF